MQIASLKGTGGIEDQMVERIQACGEFNPVTLGTVTARRAVFIAGGEEPLTVRISGLAEPIQGRVLSVENTNNPADLQISLMQGSGLLRSNSDKGVLFIPNSETGVSAPRSFKDLEDLEKTKGKVLNRIPKQDPDVVKLDGKVFRQTGSICVRGGAVLLILG